MLQNNQSVISYNRSGIRNIRFYDDSLPNILDVAENKYIDCRQVVPEKLVKPTFDIREIAGSFEKINNPANPLTKVLKKKNGITKYNEWVSSGLPTNYELYKQWILSPEQGWISDEGIFDPDLEDFMYLLENKRFQNNPANPRGIYSKHYSIGPDNHPGRRSFQDFYTGLTIAEMLDIINWSDYLNKQGTKGIVLFDFDGVINLGNGISLFDIFEDDFNHSSEKFGRNITIEGFVKFFIGTKQRFDTLKLMFETLYSNQTYFFILTFMSRCHPFQRHPLIDQRYSIIYQRFLQVLNPHFEYCVPVHLAPYGIQPGNIMCCTDPTHISGAKQFVGKPELRGLVTKLEYLYYFLGNDLNQWFHNSLFKNESSIPLEAIGGKKSKKTTIKKKRSVKKKKVQKNK